MVKHLKIRVFGRVQGVFFRSSARDEAVRLGIKGYTKNEPDGTVYMEIEGVEKNLEKFIDWCKKGPGHAQVEKIQVSQNNLKNFDKFDIF